MQFIKKQNTLVCQFASPLDVDTHVKPETQILEGKYWKRRAEAVIAEYKKWRMFHIMKLLGKGDTAVQDTISDMEAMDTLSQCGDLAGNMLTDEDYLAFMSDTLFSAITNHQPFAFPDCREIARGASLADFIQPSLGPLQPNLDDFMDTLEPLQDLFPSNRLPPVPEESAILSDDPYRSGMSIDSYQQGYHSSNSVTMPTSQMTIHGTNNNTQMMSMPDSGVKNEQMRMYDNGRFYQNNMLNSQEMMYPATSYESQTAPGPAQHSEPMQTAPGPAQHSEPYSGKVTRMQYVNPPKIVTQSDNTYNKYNSGVIPPSQTAPETVSLLQAGTAGQGTKYASGVVINRPAYRDKRPTRLQHYTPLPTQHYQNAPYNASIQPPSAQSVPPSATGYSRSAPYALTLQPHPASSFKMPSPPLTPAVSLQVQNTASTSGSRGKEQYRSLSLPVGAQLNADWTVTAAPASAPAHVDNRQTHAARSREPHTGAMRVRSSSSGAGVEGPCSSSGRRLPPAPLQSVASEPTLPQASIMLAQLLSAHHSQSMYRLSPSEEQSTDPTKSPVAKGLPSPIGSDVMSPHQVESVSPPTSPGSPRAGSPREPRRTHLHAEQKRRYNIKNGFDTLQALIPHLSNSPTAKISKAAMLQKGAEYIKQLKAERNQIKEEMENLRQQIECLNNSISNCHSLLPATGAPVSRARAGRLREMFARHVANRTMQNWKYWLFSMVSAALVESFSACVSCGNSADLVRTTLLWAEQHCSLVEMRPAVLNSLRVLCTTTDILTNPERLPEEARAAASSSAGVKTEPT